MNKLQFIAGTFFAVSSVIVCMEPISFTLEEVKNFKLEDLKESYAETKEMHKENEQIQNDHTPCCATCNVLKIDPVYQRLAVSEQKVKDKFAKRLHKLVGNMSVLITQEEQPLGQDWPFIKRALAVCEFLTVESHCDAAARKQLALRFAIWHNDVGLTGLMLVRGAQAGKPKFNEPLYCDARSVSMAKLLQQYGADYINWTTPTGYTFLHRACNLEYSADLIFFCLKQGISVNVTTDYSKETPLHVLASNAYYQSPARTEGKLKALLDAGADCLRKNEEGQIPLIVACGYAALGDEPGRYPQSIKLCINMLVEAQIKQEQAKQEKQEQQDE